MEETMKSGIRLAAVAVALLSGLSIAVAAGNGASKTGANQSSANSSSAMTMPTDTLVLSQKQQKTAWKDISTLAAKEPAPKGFTAVVGAMVPSKLDTHPVPVSTANKVPSLRPFQYALLDSNKLLIVNPNDKKIADIITQ
jgi:hypothetical protein